MDWRSILRVIFLGRPSRSMTYAVTFALLMLATALRYVLSPYLGPNSPFITFIPVIVMSSWIGGFEGGFVATLASTLLAGHYFMPPATSTTTVAQSLSRVELFAFEGVLISALGHGHYKSSLREAANARKAAQNASLAEARAKALEISEEQRRLAIEGAKVGTWHLDILSRQATFSATMKQLLGVPETPDTIPMGSIEPLHPDDRELVRTTIIAAIESHTDFDIEYRVIWPDGSIHWHVGRGSCKYDDAGNMVSIEAVSIDITERKEAEEALRSRAESESALNKISKAILASKDPSEVQSIALAEMSRVLRVDRCLSVVVDEARDSVTFVEEWHKPMLRDLLGEYRLSDFGVNLTELFADTAAFVVENLECEPRLSPTGIAAVSALDLTAFITVPMSIDTEIIGIVAVGMANEVRSWTGDEVSFVAAVAAQLRSATESGRALSQARNRAMREALLNRIGEVMRGSLNPDEIQARAVDLLGEALAADRCYFGIYNLGEGTVTIGHDWRRPDLPSIPGVHHFVNTVAMFSELYADNSTSIIRDRDGSGLSPQTIENMRGLQLRSRVSVAVSDLAGMATLTAAMSDAARDWTADEVDLMERVASLLRSGVEMARVQQREHRIATDLQAALLPAPLNSVPGLKISACMQAALAEAEIGGDFIDVFPLDNDLFALVIGDVSGKGLAAAGQLATVRNSLRAYLYVDSTPSRAVTMLNTQLTKHRLLNGFVTLFAGVYDPSTSSLTYASCGHEPVLVRRWTGGAIEELSCLGLPIGVDAEAEFVHKTVQLDDGDVVLFYTDGLSEAGPSRKEMLGTEGVIQILEKEGDCRDTDNSANSIMSEVRIFANGRFRDDVCLMVACRTDDPIRMTVRSQRCVSDEADELAVNKR